MEIEVQSIGRDKNVFCFQIKGEMGHSILSIPEFVSRVKKNIDSLIEKGQCRIIFNLRNTGELGKTILGALARKVKEVRAHRGDIKIIGLDEDQKEYLKMLGVNRTFATYETEEEAIKSFKG